MKRVLHYEKENNPLHIETQGGVVNVYSGLVDVEGQPVTNVTIHADQGIGEEYAILLPDGSKVKSFGVRIVKQEEPEQELFDIAATEMMSHKEE